VPTGDLPEQEQPRSRPLAYEPPSWDAYFGKAEESAPADPSAPDAAVQRFPPAFDATQAIQSPAAYQPQVRQPNAPQPYAPQPYGQQNPPTYGQQPYGQQPYAQPNPQPYGWQPHEPAQAAPAQFGASSYEEQPFGAPGDGGGPRPAWVIPAVIAAVAAAFGIALGAMFGLGSDDTQDPGTAAATTPTPSASQPEATPSPEETSESPQEVTDSGEIPAAEAKATLAEHGLKLAGEPRAGWRWTDANGLNVLYVTREQLKDDGSEQAATVRVMHAAHLDGDADVLRTMQDPGQGACDTNLLTDFTPSSITVTDADGDGVAEVTVGWYYACRSDVGPFDTKLALLSDGDKYILRGTGFPQEFAPPSDELKDMPKLTFTPSPKKSSWIDGTYDTTTDLFRRIYVGGTAE
jgi:hypothetical protein